MRRVGLAAALLVAAGSPGRAQDVRAQERRVDSVVAHSERLVRARSAFDDSVRKVNGQFDTLAFGALRIVVEPGWRQDAEAAGRIASARLSGKLGSLMSRLSAERFVVKQYRSSYDDADLSNLAEVALDRPSNRNRMDAVVERDSLQMASRIEQVVKLLIAGSMEARLRAWGNGALLPDTTTTVDWLRYRVALLSTPAKVGQDCYGGDVHACKKMFLLIPTADPVSEWYNAENRRRMVQRVKANFPAGGPQEQCLAGSDSACVVVVRDYWRMTVSPVETGMRHTIASVAIQMGGERAYERMVTANGTVGERLEAAAGVPLDSVVRAWQHRIRDTRAPSEDLSFNIAAASLFWVAVCAGLGLRSTRWR